jgi:histidinol dehydrogenase
MPASNNPSTTTIEWRHTIEETTKLQVTDLRDGGRPTPAPPLAIGEEVTGAVRRILADVRERGDSALLELTRSYDGADLRPNEIIVTSEEFDLAERAVDPGVRAAIDAMIERLRDLHGRQMPQQWWDERDGVRYGEIVRPVRRAGCYVPGGRAAYPSTVAMTVVPAKVAGVEDIIVATPPRPDGSLPEAVLYAARAAGADREGAVDVIVGPGNVFVTEAKREVFGMVGIDGLAGPTELVVVADHTADPSLITSDLVAQAEHDPLATGTVVTTEPDLLERLPRDLEQARVLMVRHLDHAADVVNELAPEHLEVLIEEPEGFLPRVRSAGAVFLGPWSAVPFGDYGVGSNHVLPTIGTARFASGLRATHFMKVSAVVEVAAEAAARLAPEVAALARSEGLDGHARAVELRARTMRSSR